MATLGSLLTTFMRRAQMGTRRLSQRTGIPRTSIDNWRAGTAQRPQQWQPLLVIAHALTLTRAEADALLTAAGYPSIAILAHTLSPDDPDSQYLRAWQTPAPSMLVVAPAPLLHQLRAPVPDFVGRGDAIAVVLSALHAPHTADAATIVGVQGMGGIGKTELAYVVAHQMRDLFPDAQIVLSLAGTSATPLTAAQALQSVIHAFTPHAQLPDDLPTLEQHYRTVLYHQRALIFADDARDAAQVRSLIPPAGSVLLVTSRLRFTLPGMITIDLEQLVDADAVALLCYICPRLRPVEAQALAQGCGYLPLALRVSASILRTTPALTVHTCLSWLTDARQRLAHLRHPDDPQLDVAGSLTVSYVQLDPVTQQVFRQLGVFVADFGMELAQAVIMIPEGWDVAMLLEHLLRRNLVMYAPKRARWCLHALIRDVAQRYLEDAGELDAAMWCYTRATVQLAQALQSRYLAGGDEAVAALTSFDAEQSHIDAAHRWAALHAGTLDGDTLLVGSVLATRHLREIRSDAQRQRIPQLEQARGAAERLGEQSAEGQLLLSLGRATFDLGAFREAIPVWKRALVIFQELGDCHSQGRTLGNLGTAYARLGDPLQAISAFEQALALFRACGDRRYEGHALGNLGAAFAELNTPHVAIPYLKEALVYARAVGDRRFEAMLLHALGEAAHGLDMLQRAHSSCTDALTIARELGDRQQEAYTLITLGCVNATKEDRAGSMVAFDQALRILQEIGDRWGMATCRWHYGRIVANQGDRAAALPLLRASVAYITEIGHTQAATRMALLARLEAGEEPPALTHPVAERMVGGDAEITDDPPLDR